MSLLLLLQLNLQSGSGPSFIVGYVPVYQIECLNWKPRYLPTENGPIRFQISRMDGADCDAPASCRVVMTLPDGTTTNLSATIESLTANLPDLILDVIYPFSEIGLHVLEIAPTYPSGVTQAMEVTLDVRSVISDLPLILESAPCPGYSVAYIPVYEIECLNTSTEFTIGQNGPIRIQLSRMDGVNCDTPASISGVMTLPNGTQVDVTPSLESLTADLPSLILDVLYTFASPGLHVLEVTPVYPVGIVQGIEISIIVWS